MYLPALRTQVRKHILVSSYRLQAMINGVPLEIPWHSPGESGVEAGRQWATALLTKVY